MNKTLITTIITASMCFLIGCSKQNAVEVHTEYTPITLTKAEEGITTEVNDFGLELFKQLYKPENQMLSPLSVSLALSAAALGAEGQTEEQMCKVLGFEDYTSDQIGSYYEKIVDALLKADDRTELKIANSLWAADEAPILESYKDNLQKYYDSEVFSVDFGSAGVKDRINSWVSDNTGGKITDMISKIEPSVVIMLMNALYFSGKWDKVFNGGSKFWFTNIDRTNVQADMMIKSYEGGYSSSNGFEMAELAYGNTAFVMDIILPDKELTFEEAVRAFDEDIFKDLLKLQHRDINIKMPSFKFESSFDLSTALKAMGMELPFSGNADFTGISDEMSLFISDVSHKTSIEVNKDGTVAAAATNIGMMEMADEPPIDFRVDRTFLFVIRERSTNTILFIGQKVKI